MPRDAGCPASMRRELRAVADLAKRAEKHYRDPQDIEWAIDADLPDGENLLLLQARPETIHRAKPPTATMSQRLRRVDPRSEVSPRP